jgi:hypothetical protein
MLALKGSKDGSDPPPKPRILYPKPVAINLLIDR